MSFFLMVSCGEYSVLDDYHSFIEFFHAFHDPSVIHSAGIDPDSPEKCEMVFDFIAKRGVLVVGLHASQFCLLYLLLKEVSLLQQQVDLAHHSTQEGRMPLV